MNEAKLQAFQAEVAKDVAYINSELLRISAEVDSLQAQLIALREMIEDRQQH